ncbi:TetR/AcrR family transcriptional regulator [Yunchengibacter salinarum]|uniref:TetR/AcrR family transcriptional regulator n=1 Tax=Yunchengibacter salinarum TaxID=3133399 RepID=UPI0035B60B6E
MDEAFSPGAVMPLPSDLPEDAGPQARKSALTRERIIKAAIQVLLEEGYAGITTPRIAEKAGLSRGAMMHHFSNRLTVITGVIDYLHGRRLRAFRSMVESVTPGPDGARAVLDRYWEQVNHPYFIAFYELTVAARTDEGLRAVLQPRKDAFHKIWRQLAEDLFPHWRRDRERFDLALTLTQNLMEGMAFNHMTGALSGDQAHRLIDHLEDTIRALRP